MKSTVLRFALALLFLCPTLPAVAAKCSPTGVCTACKNCSGCANCARDGGRCSVCAGTAKPTAPEAKPEARPTAKPQNKVRSNSSDFTGRVVGVSDGDTVSVLFDGGAIKVRLWGIDAPEKAQPFGERAKQFASAQAFDQTVRVRNYGRDRYGRTLGVVILPNGAELNTEMVRAGFAWWYRQYAPDAVELGELEQTARAARIGLWADAAPVAPWLWRKAKKR